MKSVAVILGSAFQDTIPQALNLARIEIQTGWGMQALYRVKNYQRPAYLLFRHGLPHQSMTPAHRGFGVCNFTPFKKTAYH